MLKDTLKFLLQFVTVGLALAFLLLFFYPEKFLPVQDTRQNIIPIAGKNPVEIVSYHEAIARIAPAVVNVYATQIVSENRNPLYQDPLFRRFFGDPVPEQQVNNNLGSGVILDGSGYLLTNAHVINQADEIRVTLTDGRQVKADIVGIDTETDLAVLSVALEDLPVASIGNSDALQVGDVVLAIGNPYDFGQTVTQGIVSATRRSRVGITLIEDFIQTDAAINPGNSGGALINAKGELVGINTAIYSRSGGSQGIGFAIPIDMAIDVMQQLIRTGYVVRGWLGISAQPVPMDISESFGLDNSGIFVTAVFGNSPAAQAGVKPGDIIMKVNGDPLMDAQQAIQKISGFQPGEMVNLDIIRGWDRVFLTAEVSQRPKIVQQGG